MIGGPEHAAQDEDEKAERAARLAIVRSFIFIRSTSNTLYNVIA
jgi:hypothetical protein